VLTAIVSAWLRLGSFRALGTSRYGNILLLKIAVAAIALALGWYHSKRVVPAAWTDDVVASFRRSALAELVVGLVIVAITAVLVSTPLPR
jgi:putative copper export protein